MGRFYKGSINSWNVKARLIDITVTFTHNGKDSYVFFIQSDTSVT